MVLENAPSKCIKVQSTSGKRRNARLGSTGSKSVPPATSKNYYSSIEVTSSSDEDTKTAYPYYTIIEILKICIASLESSKTVLE